MKKHNNPYIYAGLTALSVIVATMLMIFIIFRYKDLSAGIDKITAILQPVFIGAVLAYLLAPVCVKIEALTQRFLPGKPYTAKLGRILGVFFSTVLALAVFVVLVILIVPATYNSLVDLIKTLPAYVTNLIAWIQEKLSDYPDLQKYVLNMIDTVSEKFESFSSIMALAKSDYVPSIQSLISRVGSGISVVTTVIINVIVGWIISIYLLFSRETFARQSKMTLYAIVKPRTADIILDELKFADKMFAGFLRGKIVDSAIVGVICFVSLKIMSFPDAMLISVIVGVTNIVPVVGPFIGAIPSALLIFAAEPKKCIPFVIFILVLQQLDGNVIGPKCMGSNVNLSAFWTLFAILLFGGLWGVLGMLVGVPLFAVIYDIARKLIIHNLKRHGKLSVMYGSDDSPSSDKDGTGEKAEITEEAQTTGSAASTAE